MKNSHWGSKTQKKTIHEQEKRKKKSKRFKDILEENFLKIKEDLSPQI